MDRPNLFSYATSELSQDAFICWLLDWAKPENKKHDADLNLCATRFLRKLISDESLEIQTLSIKKQYENIDVFCVINDHHALIIEDKTWTRDHSGQLQSYLKIIKKKYANKQIKAIYFKTEDQSDYSYLENEGYSTFLRESFLEILNTYSGSNAILKDYREHLQKIENETQSYLTTPLKDQWNKRTWQGFYKALKERIPTGDWDYVPNASGGFMGFWWCFLESNNEYTIYLQLEQEKLCFKIDVHNPNNRSKWREKWHLALVEKSNSYDLKIRKPKRFGLGHTMTVAIVDEYRIQGTDMHLDMDKTLELLMRAEKLLRHAYQQSQTNPPAV